MWFKLYGRKKCWTTNGDKWSAARAARSRERSKRQTPLIDVVGRARTLRGTVVDHVANYTTDDQTINEKNDRKGKLYNTIRGGRRKMIKVPLLLWNCVFVSRVRGSRDAVIFWRRSIGVERIVVKRSWEWWYARFTDSSQRHVFRVWLQIRISFVFWWS